MHYASEQGPDRKGYPEQRWLAKKMDAVFDRGQELANQGFAIVTGFGGEFVDTPGYFGRVMAHKSLQRFVELSTKSGGHSYAVMGTGFHVSENGEEDIDVADRLGLAEIGDRNVFELDGKLIWHLHHGPKPGKGPNKSVPLNTEARMIYLDSLMTKERIPDAVFYGHYHQYAVGGHPYLEYPQMIQREVRMVCAPGWKIKDRFTYKVAPHGFPPIGAVWYIPSADKLAPQLYTVPMKYRDGKVKIGDGRTR